MHVKVSIYLLMLVRPGEREERGDESVRGVREQEGDKSKERSCSGPALSDGKAVISWLFLSLH